MMILTVHLVNIGGSMATPSAHIRPTAALPASNAEHKQAVMLNRMPPQTACTVIDLQGPYVMYAPGPKQDEHWINLAFVVEIVKQQE